jgi:hypothetical protein
MGLRQPRRGEGDDLGMVRAHSSMSCSKFFAELKSGRFMHSIAFPVDYAVSVIPLTMPGYFAALQAQ